MKNPFRLLPSPEPLIPVQIDISVREYAHLRSLLPQPHGHAMNVLAKVIFHFLIEVKKLNLPLYETNANELAILALFRSLFPDQLAGDTRSTVPRPDESRTRPDDGRGAESPLPDSPRRASLSGSPSQEGPKRIEQNFGSD